MQKIIRDTTVELLTQVPFFSHLPEPLLRDLALGCESHRFDKNITILNEGEQGDCLFILESGSAKVYVGNQDEEELVLFIMQPGDFVGDIALLDDSSRSASVVALEPSTAISVSKTVFDHLLISNSELPRAIILSLTLRLREDNRRIRSLALDPVYRRLRDKLYELAGPCTDNKPLALPRKFSHRELGTLIGASRKMVSRLLSDLVVGGYIELQSNIIVIARTLPKDW